MAEATGKFEIGVDIGGTFTDVVCRDGTGAMRLVKIPTTRRNPSAGVKAAMDYMQREWRVSPDEIVRFVHGTTVATNAVLEAKGAKIGLLTTAGFKDVLEIGRQMRHQMYDLVLKPETPVFLAPGALRKEVRERVDAPRAMFLSPLDESLGRARGRRAGRRGRRSRSRSATCSPSSIRRTSGGRARSSPTRHPELMVSLSSEVDPAFREYERTCVTAFDAYIKPVVGRYLADMEQGLADGRRRGAAAGHAVARRHQLLRRRARSGRCGSSCPGPPAGVIGGLEVGRAAGDRRPDHRRYRRHELRHRPDQPRPAADPRRRRDRRLLGARADGRCERDRLGRRRRSPGSMAPARCGSARSRRARSRVPPATAAAASEATVTDASVVLGYIDPDYFAGGSLQLSARPRAPHDRDDDRAVRWASASSMQRSASIASSTRRWRKAIRLVSIGRGIDPRGYTLAAAGRRRAAACDARWRASSASPHRRAAASGRAVGAGLLAAPIEHESAAAFPRPLAGLDWPEVERALGRPRRRLRRADAAARACLPRRRRSSTSPMSATSGSPTISRFRCRPDAADPLETLYRDFLAAHDRIYGHSTEGAGPHRQSPQHPPQHRRPAGDGGAGAPHGDANAHKGTRDILTAESGRFIPADVYDRVGDGDRPRDSRSGHRRAARHDDPDRARLARDGRRRRQPDHHRRLRERAMTCQAKTEPSTRSPSRSFATSSTASPTRCSRRCCAVPSRPSSRKGSTRPPACSPPTAPRLRSPARSRSIWRRSSRRSRRCSRPIPSTACATATSTS